MNRPTASAADALETWRRRGRRYTAIVFVTFACAFIVASTYQLTLGVFGSDLGSFGKTGPVTSAACAHDLSAMAAAVDRATALAGRAHDDAAAVTSYRAALGPEWDDEVGVERRCSTDPRGRDAFAAIARFRLAGEGVARRGVIELAPLRQDVDAYVRPGPPSRP